MVDKFEIEGRFKGPKRPLYSSSMVYIIELDHMELIGAKKKLQIFPIYGDPQEDAIISPIIKITLFFNGLKLWEAINVEKFRSIHYDPCEPPLLRRSKKN